MKFRHSNFQNQKYKHIKIPCLRTTVIISVIFQKEKYRTAKVLMFLLKISLQISDVSLSNEDHKQFNEFLSLHSKVS